MDKESRRQQLYRLFGDLPAPARKVSATKLAVETRHPYVLEKLILDLNGIEPVPAYFVRPGKQDGPLPAILYNHAHGLDYALGKDELLAGRNELQSPPYAEELTRKDYVEAFHHSPDQRAHCPTRPSQPGRRLRSSDASCRPGPN